MKKLERTDKAIDFVKLFSDEAQRQGLKAYTQEAIASFGDAVRDGLNRSVESDHRIRGLRAENLFLAVVAGIGQVRLIKEEDVGELFYDSEALLTPDFRVVTNDNTQLLVEVKVQPASDSVPVPCKLSDAYVSKLRRYADLLGGKLCIAIFWEGPRVWTLNHLEAFEPGVQGESKWSLSFFRAFATNAMASLGDATVGTLAPLRFRVVVDPERSENIPEGTEGEFKLCIKNVLFVSQERVLSGLAATIAWRLAWYGRWTDGHQEPHYEDGRLKWIDHLIIPPDWESVDGPGPYMIGALSEMITNAYLSGAGSTIHTTSKAEVLEPGFMGTFIPKDFVSMNLDIPLYMFTVLPNYEYREDSGANAATD